MEGAYSREQLAKLLAPVFRRNHIRKATLFGSHAKGSATEKSDVDLMVDSGLHGLAFFGLLEDVNTSLHCDVDLIDSADIIPDSQIDREIRKTGVVIYEG